MTQLEAADLAGIKQAAAAEDGHEAFQCRPAPSPGFSNLLSVCNAVK